MSKLSEVVLESIIGKFPDFKKVSNHNSELLLEMQIQSEKNHTISLIVQVTTDNNIWLRLDIPYAFYSIDDIEELEQIIAGVLANKIFWIVSFDAEGKWFGTTLTTSINNIEEEPNIIYNIYSWNGDLDTVKRC